MKIKNIVCIFLPVFLNCCLGVARAEPHLIQQMEGYYSVPAKLCSGIEGDTYISCARSMRDCLSIKYIDEKTAQIGVESTQINGHNCGVSGIATLNGSALVYVGGDDDLDSKGKKLSIELANGKSKLRYLNEGGIGERPPFCGFRARLDLVEFDVKAKAPVGPVCPNE